MNDEAKIQRTVLPIPDPQRTGLITYDAKDGKQVPTDQAIAPAQGCFERSDRPVLPRTL